MENGNVGVGDMILAATRNQDHEHDSDWGSGCGLWVVLLIVLMMGGYGWNRNASGQPVTESALCNANNFQELMDMVGRTRDEQNSIARQTDNGIANLGYETLSNFNATQSAIASQGSSLQQQLADCCCTTQRAIDSVNYNMAANAASINETTTAQAQKVLDALCQSKAEQMQARINQLELQAALQGVMRYPAGTTYTAGYNPFFSQAACTGVSF